ncbi:MobF family relaxase [Sphingomonas lenta]|uniref:TrwC protein n=1 Tax=Sphingomonas lenta TaxID=1141887 RepID=A0A2A2SAR4_9SPHN|nr:MobF family relaxase [Sphingomonas lenta]PAX06394.1 TrwC protein [Sphingomonas lenta]
MITVALVESAGDAAGYYARDNYYTAEQAEGASAWAGRGAAELGLSGPVDAAAFERVLSGELPNGSVLDAKRGDHRPGWDLTMSASKSVSILALVGGDQRLVDAFRQSVAATLAWVEKNLAEGRVMKSGRQVPERTGNLVAATFLHDANRADEPQLHNHAVLANATRTSDGKWHALRSDELYDRQHVIDAVLNADFRARVEGIGYETLPARNPINGSFEIKGVPREAVEAFSVRSAQIQAYLDARGLQGTPRERELAALATRDPKAPTLSPELRGEGWRALAAEHGVDAGKLVSVALGRAGRAETVWSQVTRGLRGVGDRGLAVAARMGLTPRDGDPLVPERLGRLEPRAYAAAQAVASAARELGEREAAFDRLDLIRVALSRGGPVTVADVEARIAALEGKGLLIGDSGRMVTTEGAVRLERGYLAQVEAGQGKSAPIVSGAGAAARAQEVARELGLRRLNPGQEGAAVLMLSSTDRVVNVQGAAGRGKSAALAPVTAIAKAEGRHVIGLAVASKKARDLGRETGAAVSSLSRFLLRHERVIDGTASSKQLARVRAELAGAVVIMEEASLVGTRDMERLVRLANTMGVARLVQTGDTRQLNAVAAGRPFEESQRAGHATALLTENLRSKSEQMKAVVAALDRNDIPGAFEILRPATIEVPASEVASTAAGLWAALPRQERESTLLLASGRAMRTAANQAAQAELKAAGEIAAPGVRMDVLDPVNATREGARHMPYYQPGRVVEIRTDLPSQKLGRGDRGTVVGVDGDRVLLKLGSGEERVFRPGRLPKNLKNDAVSIYAVKQVELHRGDRIRWTGNDLERGIANSDLARVEEVGRDKLVVSSLHDGAVHELGRGDPMLERLDLAYAVNVHVSQGVTVEHGILAMNSAERRLLSEKTFLVSLTRIADNTRLVLDDGRKVERGVMRNPGDKTSALDVVAQGGAPDAIRLRYALSPIDRAIERCARSFVSVEKARDDRTTPSPNQERELAQAAAALDAVRPKGAEDLQVALDRHPDLARDVAQGRVAELRQAWVEEGRVRADPTAYADRFVADWRAASGERGAAETRIGADRAERRLERLEERMQREPALEHALDKRIPERQRQIEEPGRGGLGRGDRDFELGL